MRRLIGNHRLKRFINIINVIFDHHRMTKASVKTGMCKINESPWQLQLEARCFTFFVSCEGSGMVVSSAFTSKIWMFEENLWEDVFCRDSRALVLFPPHTHTHPPDTWVSWHSEELIKVKTVRSIRSLRRQNDLCISLRCPAGISSPILISSKLFTVTTKNLPDFWINELNLHFLFSQKTGFFVPYSKPFFYYAEAIIPKLQIFAHPGYKTVRAAGSLWLLIMSSIYWVYCVCFFKPSESETGQLSIFRLSFSAPNPAMADQVSRRETCLQNPAKVWLRRSKEIAS